MRKNIFRSHFFGSQRVRLLVVAILICAFSAAASSQSVSGTVTDTFNAPVPNARITLRDGGRAVAETTSDGQGRFSLRANRTPKLTLTAVASGFADLSLSLPAGFVESVSITLQPSPLRENVTVSITRSETRLSETPASVVVLDRQTLDSTAAQSVDDILRQVAGFTLFRRSSSKTSNPTAQGANLRGVSGSGASRAAVLFDGLSLNDAFGGWTFWSRVPQIAVERAEVLRGGASAFYGSGGLSGAVNLTTPRSGEGPIFRFQTSAGSQSTYDGSFFTAAEKSGWAFDAAAETFQTAGYIPIAKNERGLADTGADSRHNNGILTIERNFHIHNSLPRGGVAPAAGDGVVGENGVGEDAAAESTQSNSNARIFLHGNLFAERRDNGTSLTYNQTYFRQLSGGADLSDEIFGDLQFRTFIETQVYDQTFSAVSADRNTETLSRSQRVPSQARGANLFWAKPFGPHAINASFELREVRGFSDEVGYFGRRPTSTSGSGGTERTVSAFAQDIWHATGKLHVNFGARVDHWENVDAHSTTRTLATNAVSNVPFPDRSQNAFSPRVAALYQLNGSVSLYGSYSRSFRAPTLNELYRGFRVGNVVTQANENLSAERANTFEAGANFTGLRQRLNIRGNAFVTQVSDPVVSVTRATTPASITRQRRNVGETRTRGVELDADIILRPDLRFSASYLLADSRVTKFPASPELVGKFLPQIARQQLTFQINYRPPSRFSFGIQSRISDAQFEDDLNTLRLRPYFTMDATASYRVHKNIELFAAAENFFNTRYDIGLTPNRTVAAPAFVRGGLRFSVGRK